MRTLEKAWVIKKALAAALLVLASVPSFAGDYTIRVADGAEQAWDGNSEFKAEIPKIGMLLITQEFARKEAVSADVLLITSVDKIVVNKGKEDAYVMHVPRYGMGVHNRCELSVGETCVGQDKQTGQTFYTIRRDK